MHLEPLEPRIAPAALVGGKLTYTDVDNDLVTITFSKKTGLDENDFVFNTAFSETGPQKLLAIDLQDDAALKGVNITMKVSKVGDGKVDVGAIRASGVDLGTIKLLGDLQKIEAGSGQGTAVKGLSVQSWGTKTDGLAILPGQGLPTELFSVLQGKFGKITVAGDFQHANLQVFNAPGTAKSASFTVGGKLLGGSASGDGILQLGNVGAVKFGGIVGANLETPETTFGAMGGVLQLGSVGTLTIAGDIEGGNFVRSGSVEISGTAGKVTVGKLVGGHAERTGFLSILGKAGAVSVGGIVGGNLTGPGDFVAGGQSGGLRLQEGGTSLTVRDGVLGGSISGSGQIFVSGGVKKLTLIGDVTGSDGAESGSVRVEGKVTTFKLTGSVIGGTKNESGKIRINELGTGTIVGDLVGSDAAPTDVGGSFGVTGGLEIDRAGSLKITGSILGGDGREEAGKLDVGELKNLTVIGQVEGGAMDESGNIDLGLVSGAVTVRGGLKGGSGENTGSIRVETAKSVTVTGLLEGGTGPTSGSVLSTGVVSTVTAGGLQASTGNLSGSVVTFGNFKTVLVKGDVIGLAENAAHIGAGGTQPGLALGSVTVIGKMVHGRITAGIIGDFEISADASIGKVTIGKEFTASAIAAGVNPLEGFFADGNDGPVDGTNEGEFHSKIGLVTLKGLVLGTSDPTNDSFGIVAQEVAKVIVGKKPVVLNSGAATDLDGVLIGGTTDVRVREIGLAF